MCQQLLQGGNWTHRGGGAAKTGGDESDKGDQPFDDSGGRLTLPTIGQLEFPAVTFEGHCTQASPLWVEQHWWIYFEGQRGYSGKGRAIIAMLPTRQAESTFL